MTTETKPATQAEAWDRFCGSLKAEFGGKDGQAIRRQILATVRGRGEVGMLRHSIAFNTAGRASLARVAEAAADWQRFAFGPGF